MPLISVVIPVFNRGTLLLRAIDSVKKQTFTDYEIIVVDDYSLIDISAYTENQPIQLVKSIGKGVSAARNTGIRKAKGDWIAFLDSDDEWIPNKLEKQWSYLTVNSDCRFLHSNEVWLRDGKIITQSLKQKKSGGKIFAPSTERCLIGASTVLAEKNLLIKLGLFDENFPTCEDYDLWLRVTSCESVGFLEEPLIYKHGGHSDQLSRQYHSMDLWRVRALYKHWNNTALNAEEREALKTHLFKKAKILLKGFEKYPNKELEQEIKNYLALPID